MASPYLFSASALVAVLALGCTAAPANDETASVADEIIGGRIARDFPEAVLVDSDRGYCSGAVIAPRVVLTAGHCVKGASRWTVTAPFADNQTSRSETAWTEYTAFGGLLNPRAIDVALIILDTPIELASYPTIATEMARNNTKAFNVGRVRNGVVSRSARYYGEDVSLTRGQPNGYPYAYISEEVVESGDSGGPVYVKVPGGRKIVAVNSGGAGGRQVLGRVDLVHEKIAELIAEHR